MPDWRLPVPALLPPADELGVRLKLRIAVEAALTGLRVRRLVRRQPLPDVLVTLRRHDADVRDQTTASAIGARLGHPVGRALAPLPGDSRCLIRSLVLIRMLARRGVTSELVIGVAAGETFEAHAWVERDGDRLLPSLGFEPLTRL